MADHSVGRFALLHYDPGNPEFPTLPDGIDSLHIIEIGRAPGLSIRAPIPDVLQGKHSATGGTGYADWYLNGIWRQPDPVDFGNITATKQRTVILTNTSRSSVSLTAIDVSAITGLSVVSPGLPATIEAFDSLVVTFEVSTTGDPAFDDEVLFTVGGLVLPVRMLGRRVIIFNTVPEIPINERISWLTDNMISIDGTEQAFSLRRAPRSRVVINQVLDDDEERTRQFALITGAGFLRMGVQQWWQARAITSAALSTDLTIQVNALDMEFDVGSNLSFVTPSGAIVEGEVESFTASSVTLTQEVGLALPLNTYVMPLKFGFLSSEVNVKTFARGLEETQLIFELIEYADIGALNMAYFTTHPVDGLPIITYPMAFDGGARDGNWNQTIDVLDGSTGDIQQTRTELAVRPGNPVLVYCNSQADQHAWRQFLHFVRGSWGAFYIPTDMNDLPLASVFTLGSNTFSVPSMGLESLIGLQAPRRDLKLNIDGTIYYRRITDISDNGTTEVITLNSAIPGAGTVPIEDVIISWLTLSRIVGDSATFKHAQLGDSELRFAVRGVIV